MAKDNHSFETTLHDVVYSIDAGTGLRIIRIAIYVLIVLAVLMLYTATQFRGLRTNEAMDYAQLGRNVSLSTGFQTKNVRPLSMWKVSQRTAQENPRIKDHPDLFHPPAYPFVLAVGFKVFDLLGMDPFSIDPTSRSVAMPAEQWVVLPLNHAFVLLTGFLVFLLGKRLFSRDIGFLGMSIYFVSNLVWKDSISGLNISMATFFITAAFYGMIVSMLNHRDNKPTRTWVLPFLISVGCSAIAFLTRYIAIAAIPGIVLFAWLIGGRFRGGTRYVVVYLVLFMVLISPWLYRNVVVSGNPMGMTGYTALMDSAAYPGNVLERELLPEFSVKKSVAILKQKWVVNFSEKNAAALPGLGGGILMALFGVTFFYHFVRPQVNYLRWGIGLSLLVMVVIAGFFSESSVTMLHAFWPFIILYGLSFFSILVDRLDLGASLYTKSMSVLIFVLAAIPLALTLMPPAAKSPYPPYWPPVIAQVSDMLNPSEVMCSDMPWATAWYGDQVSILLPSNLESFYEINDYKQYVSGLYVTAITKNKPFASDLLVGPEKSWFPIVRGQIPNDFPLKEGVSLNPEGQDQIFFSDRDRWSIK